MKRPTYATDNDTLKLVRKASRYVKQYLYSTCIPFRVDGCLHSPSVYFSFLCMNYKDKLIRISNHRSSNPHNNTSNVYNVIIETNVIDNTWMQNEIHNIKLWLQGGLKDA